MALGAPTGKPFPQGDDMPASTKETAILTVAAIRKPKGEGVVEFLFHERQRIFTLPLKTKSLAELSKNLEESFRKKAPLRVVLNTRKALVHKVDAPSPEELGEFQKLRALLEKPDKTLAIDVSSLDPTTFNIVDR